MKTLFDNGEHHNDLLLLKTTPHQSQSNERVLVIFRRAIYGTSSWSADEGGENQEARWNVQKFLTSRSLSEIGCKEEGQC